MLLGNLPTYGAMFSAYERLKGAIAFPYDREEVISKATSAALKEVRMLAKGIESEKYFIKPLCDKILRDEYPLQYLAEEICEEVRGSVDYMKLRGAVYAQWAESEKVQELRRTLADEYEQLLTYGELMGLPRFVARLSEVLKVHETVNLKDLEKPFLIHLKDTFKAVTGTTIEACIVEEQAARTAPNLFEALCTQALGDPLPARSGAGGGV